MGILKVPRSALLVKNKIAHPRVLRWCPRMGLIPAHPNSFGMQELAPVLCSDLSENVAYGRWSIDLIHEKNH